MGLSEDKYRLVVCHDKWGDTWLSATDEGGTHKVVPRDAIVVKRARLPEVTVDPSGGYRVEGEYFGSGALNADRAALAWTYALRAVALAEHLRANPPVDEAQVYALSAALARARGAFQSDDYLDEARRLVQAGVRVEVTP